MDKELIASYGFLLLGLGFFLFVINLVTREHHTDYRRWLMEAREFGFDKVTNRKRRRFSRKNQN